MTHTWADALVWPSIERVASFFCLSRRESQGFKTAAHNWKTIRDFVTCARVSAHCVVLACDRHQGPTQEGALFAMKARESEFCWFVLLAYGLTWVLLGPWFYCLNVVNRGEMSALLWALVPLALIGGWGPTVAALVVTARADGGRAAHRLAAKLAHWRVPVRWYLFVLLLPPFVTAFSLLIADRGFTTLRHFDIAAALAGVPLIYAIALPFGPLGEELGWRGFALPRLLDRFGPRLATLMLAAIWTFWHIPMMLWMPGASIPSFMELSMLAVLIYLAQVTSVTAIMTLVFMRTNGNVLLAVLAHLAFNTAESIVFAGLPEVSEEHQRSLYLVNVGVLVFLGLAAMLFAGKSNTTLAPLDNK